MYSPADKFLLDERQELVDCLSNTGLSFDVNWWPWWHVTRATRSTRVLLHALWSFARGRWPSDRSRVKSQLFMLGRAGRPVGTRYRSRVMLVCSVLWGVQFARVGQVCRQPATSSLWNESDWYFPNSSVKLYYICIFWHIALYVSAHTHVHLYVALLSILTPHQHVMTQFTGAESPRPGKHHTNSSAGAELFPFQTVNLLLT